MQPLRKVRPLLLALGVCFYSVGPLEAHTANKVWFEFHPTFYRVVVHYTVLELKELREAYIEFYSKKKAEKVYFDLLRGAEFYLDDHGNLKFKQQNKKPEPW